MHARTHARTARTHAQHTQGVGQYVARGSSSSSAAWLEDSGAQGGASTPSFVGWASMEVGGREAFRRARAPPGASSQHKREGGEGGSACTSGEFAKSPAARALSRASSQHRREGGEGGSVCSSGEFARH